MEASEPKWVNPVLNTVGVTLLRLGGLHIIIIITIFLIIIISTDIGRPPSLSELTPIVFNTGLTYLGSEASI